uniref:Uncharacterized protein n=1 Tax=Rhizophora mucronata TaxID=61149 RepID=A0A2P2R2V5_RHIMU
MLFFFSWSVHGSTWIWLFFRNAVDLGVKVLSHFPKGLSVSLIPFL